jgi:hypothetical protein
LRPTISDASSLNGHLGISSRSCSTRIEPSYARFERWQARGTLYSSGVRLPGHCTIGFLFQWPTLLTLVIFRILVTM